MPSTPTTPTRPSTKAPTPAAGADFTIERGFSAPDLATWQKQMVQRGWDLQVDGIFGPRTLQVLKSFQAEKGLAVDGILGPQSWAAAWTTAVT